jgi:hypothetical protein
MYKYFICIHATYVIGECRDAVSCFERDKNASRLGIGVKRNSLSSCPCTLRLPICFRCCRSLQSSTYAGVVYLAGLVGLEASVALETIQRKSDCFLILAHRESLAPHHNQNTEVLHPLVNTASTAGRVALAPRLMAPPRRDSRGEHQHKVQRPSRVAQDSRERGNRASGDRTSGHGEKNSKTDSSLLSEELLAKFNAENERADRGERETKRRSRRMTKKRPSNQHHKRKRRIVSGPALEEGRERRSNGRQRCHPCVCMYTYHIPNRPVREANGNLRNSKGLFSGSRCC